MSDNLYPLRFETLAQTTPWGGSLAGAFFHTAACVPGLGVYWELVDDGGLQSVVANGPLVGKTLQELVTQFNTELIGRRFRRETQFPICVRILDIGRDLPLLVHADEALSAATPGQQTNTKFWYCLDAVPDATVSVGIGHRVTGAQILNQLNTPAIRTRFQQFPACPGESFLIPAGRVHSAGAGTLMLEVAHRNVTPLCVSAWSPEDAGSAAEQELALRAVHFEDRQVARICRESGNAAQTRKIPVVRHCPFFMVEEIRVVDDFFDRTDGNSFHLLAAVKNSFTLETDVGKEQVPTGSFCLLPAAFGGYRCVATGQPTAILRIKLQRG